MPTLHHISQASYGVKNNHNFHQNTRTYFLLLLPTTTHYKAEKKTATISTSREVTESELMLPTTTLMLLLINTLWCLTKGVTIVFYKLMLQFAWYHNKLSLVRQHIETYKWNLQVTMVLFFLFFFFFLNYEKKNPFFYFGSSLFILK